MTGLYFPADKDFPDQLMLTGDTKIQSDRSPGQGNLTLSRCHTPSLCGIFPWLAKGKDILFRSDSRVIWYFFDWGILFWSCGVCSHLSVFPTKTFWSHLSFSGEVSTFLWILKGQTYKNSFVRLFWSTLQFFLRRKTSQSSPLDLKLDEMAKQGLDWKDNKILTNTKHDQGRTETVFIIS